MPFASASQYPVPLLSGAMPTVRDDDCDRGRPWPHVIVMSAGGAHELTKMAAMEPAA